MRPVYDVVRKSKVNGKIEMSVEHYPVVDCHIAFPDVKSQFIDYWSSDQYNMTKWFCPDLDIEVFNDPLTNYKGVMSGFGVYSCFDAAKLLNESDKNCSKVSDT